MQLWLSLDWCNLGIVTNWNVSIDFCDEAVVLGNLISLKQAPGFFIKAIKLIIKERDIVLCQQRLDLFNLRLGMFNILRHSFPILIFSDEAF